MEGIEHSENRIIMNFENEVGPKVLQSIIQQTLLCKNSKQQGPDYSWPLSNNETYVLEIPRKHDYNLHFLWQLPECEHNSNDFLDLILRHNQLLLDGLCKDVNMLLGLVQCLYPNSWNFLLFMTLILMHQACLLNAGIEYSRSDLVFRQSRLHNNFTFRMLYQQTKNQFHVFLNALESVRNPAAIFD